MKVGMLTVPFSDMTLEKTAKYLSSLGVQAVELGTRRIYKCVPLSSGGADPESGKGKGYKEYFRILWFGNFCIKLSRKSGASGKRRG